jgi:hypothetical protein
MKSVAQRLVKEAHIRLSKDCDEEKIYQIIGDHIDALIFNVASLACIVALLYDTNKLEKKHLIPVRKYIQDKCPKRMQGGMSMASDFYGYSHPSYGINNGGSDLLHIDFNSTTLRPQIGGGGFLELLQDNKHAIKAVRDVFAHHKVKASRETLIGVIAIMDEHVTCLANDLKHYKNLTDKQLDKVLKLKRHAVFQ